MKLSIIMSAYNNQDTISEAIESILNQTFTDFEFIIINDGSTDNTLNLINEYKKKDNRIVVIDHENTGLTKSLNIALRNAKGNYIARQDADDISFSERLNTQLNFLDKNQEIGFLGCNFEIFDEEGHFLQKVNIPNNYKKIDRILKTRNIFCHGAMVFRQSLLNKVNGYREFFRYGQDYDLYLRLIEFTLAGSVDKVLYRRRISIDGVSIRVTRTQLAYGEVARKCYRARKKGQDDSQFLSEQVLEECKNSLHTYDLILPFMQAFYYVRRDEIKKAREIMQAYILPVAIKKTKIYILWFFTYLPVSLRNALLSIKRKFRTNFKESSYV